MIREADLSGLPSPVSRYLRKTGIIGRSRIERVTLRQRGRFKTSEAARWAPFSAEQRYTVPTPSFVWRATIATSLLMPVKVVDGFASGRGFLEAKLFGVIRVAHARGPETDRGELLRFMSEIIWFPTAWLEPYIGWRPVDDRSARVSIDAGGISESAIIRFDDEDRVIAMQAKRYRTAADGFSLDDWRVTAAGHRVVNGMLIPMSGRATWTLPSGDFTYFDGEITSLSYET